MIEIFTSQSGHPTFRFHGQLMASRIDPVREARAWVERRWDFIRKVRSIFVLGMGAGYHVKEICDRCEAEVVVLEHERAIFDHAAGYAAFKNDRVTVEHIPSLADARASESVRHAIQHSFMVFAHAPSVALHTEFYGQTRALLTGRDWNSLQWQWQLKGMKPLEGETKMRPTAEPLSIYDLEATAIMQDSDERERMLLKALRELVK